MDTTTTTKSSSKTMRSIFIAIISIVFITGYILTIRKPESTKEKSFDLWLASIQSGNMLDNINLKIDLSLPSESKSFSYSYPEGEDVTKESKERVVRMLDLIKEANVFGTYALQSEGINIKLSAKTKNEGELSEYSKEFHTVIDPKEMTNNMPLANCVKLLELWSKK